MLILYPDSLLNSLISCGSIFIDSLGFSTQPIIYIFYFLLVLLYWLELLLLYWVKVASVDILFCSWSQGKNILLFTIKYDVSCRFWMLVDFFLGEVLMNSSSQFHIGWVVVVCTFRGIDPFYLNCQILHVELFKVFSYYLFHVCKYNL